MKKVLITDRRNESTPIEEKVLGKYISHDPSEKEEIAVLLVWHDRVDGAYMDQYPNLEGIVRYGVGYDRIDINAAKSRSIAVANTPDYCVEEVSMTAVAMILNGVRQISHYDWKARTYRAGWQENVSTAVHRPSDLHIGIVGAGRIGLATLQKVKALGFKVGLYDPYQTPGVEKIFNSKRFERLEELLAESDLVSIHVPLSAETNGMIDYSFISDMKPGAMLVNTARGALLNEVDLILDALNSGHLSYVALDVLPEEPPVGGRLFEAWRSGELTGRLCINPHSAYHSVEAEREMRRKAAANAMRVVNGIGLINRVDNLVR